MSGAVTKTNKHNTNKEDIPNSSHLPFIGTADTDDTIFMPAVFETYGTPTKGDAEAHP